MGTTIVQPTPPLHLLPSLLWFGHSCLPLFLNSLGTWSAAPFPPTPPGGHLQARLSPSLAAPPRSPNLNSSPRALLRPALHHQDTLRRPPPSFLQEGSASLYTSCLPATAHHPPGRATEAHSIGTHCTHRAPATTLPHCTRTHCTLRTEVAAARTVRCCARCALASRTRAAALHALQAAKRHAPRGSAAPHACAARAHFYLSISALLPRLAVAFSDRRRGCPFSSSTRAFSPLYDAPARFVFCLAHAPAIAAALDT